MHPHGHFRQYHFRATPHRSPRCWTCPRSAQLIADLDETRWTGRPGYPVRDHGRRGAGQGRLRLPTWTRTARLIAEHAALREAIGGAPVALGVLPVRREAARARRHADRLHRQVLAALREAHPEMGQTVAIDGSDMPAYANGHKHVGNKNGPLRTRFADPDAGWGHRSSISTRKGGALLRLQIAHGRLHRDGTAARVDRQGGQRARAGRRCPACWTR